MIVLAELSHFQHEMSAAPYKRPTDLNGNVGGGGTDHGGAEQWHEQSW
jgi:hypothetical protein